MSPPQETEFIWVRGKERPLIITRKHDTGPPAAALTLTKDEAQALVTFIQSNN